MENNTHLLVEPTPLDSEPFTFHCHPGVSCYLKCCHDTQLFLFPYDVLRLKNHLKIPSSEFMRRHTRIGEGSHPYFPGVMLNMAQSKGFPCPFLCDEGCSVYKDRPSACRTYPLERGVEKLGSGKGIKAHYFMTHHPYCKGHFEDREYTIKQWERDQGIYEFNLMNDLWAEVDAFFGTNPWQGEGKAGPLQQLAFMVCYNIDDFRAYCNENNLVKRFSMTKSERNLIKRDDAALLKFGFLWLQFYIGGRSTLRPK